jgi:hypothetical protein
MAISIMLQDATTKIDNQNLRNTNCTCLFLLDMILADIISPGATSLPWPWQVTRPFEPTAVADVEETVMGELLGLVTLKVPVT